MDKLSVNMEKFEKFLNEFVSHDIELYSIIKYQMGWVNEHGEMLNKTDSQIRNFAISTLIINKILLGDMDKAIPLASGIELLGNSWFVHGDVENGITHRNGKPTVWWVWGPAQAINTGDGFHALARLVIGNDADNQGDKKTLIALNRFDLAFLNLSEGESLDISYQDKPIVSIQEYINMIKKRSGSILGCAFEFGLLSSDLSESADAKQLEIFNGIGVNLGILRQLENDWKTIFENNLNNSELFNRFSSKKKNIGVLYSLEYENPSVKRKIGEIYLKRVLDEEDRKNIQNILGNTDFKQFYENLKEQAENKVNSQINKTILKSDQKNLLKLFCKEKFSE